MELTNSKMGGGLNTNKKFRKILTPDLSNMKRAVVYWAEYCIWCISSYKLKNTKLWLQLEIIIRPCASDSGNQSRAAWQRADTGQTSPRGTVQCVLYSTALYTGNRYRGPVVLVCWSQVPAAASPCSPGVTAFLLENTRTESEFDALMICRNTVCR